MVERIIRVLKNLWYLIIIGKIGKNDETIIDGTRLISFKFNDYCVIVIYKLKCQSNLVNIISWVRGENAFKFSFYCLAKRQWCSNDVVAYVFFREESNNSSQKKADGIVSGMVEKINQTILGWKSQEEKE